jgi:hypothetical protein
MVDLAAFMVPTLANAWWEVAPAAFAANASSTFNASTGVVTAADGVLKMVINAPQARNSLSAPGVVDGLLAGLPEEVAHIAGAHSGEGELLVRSLEATIVHLADIGYWTLALAGGLIKPETVSSKYRRPLVM